MVYEIANAKALLVTLFLEYLVYAFVYIIEGIRLEAFDQAKAITKSQPKPPPAQTADGGAGAADLNEIELQDKATGEKAKPEGAEKDAAAVSEEDLTDDFDTMHFLQFIP